MKFITEMELRDLYRRDSFTTFVLEPDTKITPGARQFLVDRRVTLKEAQLSDDNKATNEETNHLQAPKNLSTLRLIRKMEWIESLFLLTAVELLHSGNAILSEELTALGKCFQNVHKAEGEQSAPDNIQFWGWSEEEIKERSDDLEKHVDISEFHLELENSKEISLLNHLRASLREVEPFILETYWIEEEQVCSRQDLIDSIDLMINILSMMIWKCMGGKKWKK